MKSNALAHLLTMVGVSVLTGVTLSPQGSRIENEDQLRSLIDGNQIESKKLGLFDKPKFEYVIKKDESTIPIMVWLSPDKDYLLLRAYLGITPKEPQELKRILALTAEVRPIHYYFLGEKLFAGLSIDNRDVTPEILTRASDRLANTIIKSGIN